MHKSLWDSIKGAEERGSAIGHFNFAELTVLKAAIAAAKELNAPIILGASEKEREFVGTDIVRLIVGHRKSLLTYDVNNIFFNADHTKSFEKAKEAVEIGYDSITFDNSHLPLEENIAHTKEVVQYVKLVNPKILVEGEIGYIGDGSQVRDEIPAGIEKTRVEDAVRFVRETDIDMLAPAVGNIHGIIKTGEPTLAIDLIKKIKDAVKIPLVLHGASGNTDEDIRAAIKAGISIVHINTEIRVAWRTALEESLHGQPNEVAPYKILALSVAAVKKAIMGKLKLFRGVL